MAKKEEFTFAENSVEFSEIKEKHKNDNTLVGIDVSKPTILYAPAWENDNKQDEFVQAMLPLDVNIIVKSLRDLCVLLLQIMS